MLTLHDGATFSQVVDYSSCDEKNRVSSLPKHALSSPYILTEAPHTKGM